MPRWDCVKNQSMKFRKMSAARQSTANCRRRQLCWGLLLGLEDFQRRIIMLFKYSFSALPDMYCRRKALVRPLVPAAQLELDNLGRLDEEKGPPPLLVPK